MKFAILTDIHLGPEGHYKGVLRKMNKDVKIFLDDFVAEMNNNVKPEFVVVLGDLVEDDNEINDKNNIDYIVKLLKKLECPVYCVAGNHDLKNISEAQKWVAEMYFKDGSINLACPPLKALLYIMAEGSYEGKGVENEEIRSMFSKDYLLSSDWYKERLLNKT